MYKISKTSLYSGPDGLGFECLITRFKFGVSVFQYLELGLLFFEGEFLC